jgi:Prenyltransferase and squalene oxidase repeat
MVSYSEELLERQNQDGGWSYNRSGSSWTEPTCYALLALATGGVSPRNASRTAEATHKGIEWLVSRQRPDGGWAPRDGVDQSTWVTALTLLVPSESGRCGDNSRASGWLLGQTGRESGFVYRLRLRLLGFGADSADQFDGWPWYPGTAAWVGPTALTVLALQKFNHSARDVQIEKRIADGRAFLLARRCRDGGWNHGSTHSLGYDSDSYPETTGLALLALHGTPQSQLGNALDLAERHLRESRSLEATSWLVLGLLANGRSRSPGPLMKHDGTIALAVAALSGAALQGRNLFVG